jgi:tetratricopeptide (TPR) repeat protein/O-antigen ligase
MTDSERPMVAAQTGVWVLRICLLAVPLFCLPGQYRVAHYPKLLLLLVAVAALLGCCAISRRWVLPLRTPFVLPLLVYMVILSLQAFRGLNPPEALLVLASQLGFGLLALATACLVPRGQQISLIRYAVAGGAVAASIGILEHLGVDWAMLPSAGRPSSTFGFRNVGGMYTAACLFLTVPLLTGRKQPDLCLGLVGLGTMLPYLLYTRSRGAWLGLLVGCITWGLNEAWKLRAAQTDSRISLSPGIGSGRRWAVGSVLVVSLATGWISPGYVGRGVQRLDEKKSDIVTTLASTLRQGGDRGRLRVWRATMNMVLDHPLAGVGLQNWAAYYPLYDRGDVLALVSAPRRPHNDYLWLWAELGILGLLVYAWLVGSACRSAVSSLRRTGLRRPPPGMFFGLVIVALLTHSFFSFPRELAAPSMLFWVSLGLVGRGPANCRPVGKGLRLVAAVGALVILLGVWAMVDAVRFDRYLFRASVAQAVGDTGTQAGEARAARNVGLFDHRALLLLGDAQYQKGDLEGARETYESYVTIQPYLPAIRNNLGRVYADLGRFEDAEAAYRAGLEVYAGNPILVNNLAGLYKSRGMEDKALALYRTHGAGTARAQHNLGLILAQRGEYDSAMLAYRRAQEMDPQLAEVLYSRSGLQMVIGEFDSSAAGFEAFLEVEGISPAYAHRARGRLLELYPVLGDRLLAEGDWAESLRVFSRLVDLGGGGAKVLNNIAVLYRKTGDPKRALAACDRAIRTFPDSAEAYFTRALLLDDSGDRAAARATYRSFLKRWPAQDRFHQHAVTRISELER